MATVYFLDVPENVPIVEVAERDERVRVERTGPYFAVSADTGFEIDRRATGSRHAVWYSCVAGLGGFRISGWDKDSLRLKVRT
ncbi:hypothetical protein [Amycolatopsis pithecellobii]|uniref:Uncharacterized protein n=1 Tax=Amycolatopsis pithecellobii TaxID=664692 RepID=A0A6N7ZAY8_9PSEU|nr:hypothetical protein [Amycolatopsis pithecellobii]MTD58922.1 hypothetical protein [Amycolatopsis pithecellobii]